MPPIIAVSVNFAAITLCKESTSYSYAWSDMRVDSLNNRKHTKTVARFNFSSFHVTLFFCTVLIKREMGTEAQCEPPSNGSDPFAPNLVAKI